MAVFAGDAAGQAAIPEQLCDTKYQNCRDPLMRLIQNEKQAISVAFWFMEDARYVTELEKRKAAGVRIRILMDQRANATKRLNATILQMFRDRGFAMRERYTGDILHFKTMIFHGQRMVQFSKANYTDPEFVPITPNVNFSDEAVFFTDEDVLVDSFMRRFDDLWTNTSSYRNYANVTGTLVRECPACTIHSSMNFPPAQDFSNRSVLRYNAETSAIDAVSFRITDDRHSNAMINAVARGVRVRLISEPSEYRNPLRPFVAKHIDRMWRGGVQIKMRRHEGLMHQASVVLHGLGEVIFGSSNWTTASAGYQDEHNFFYNPSLGKPWFFTWFANQFQSKWNDSANFTTFTPLPPGTPASIAPANGATGLGTTVELRWDGGTWAHLYDIEIGTAPAALTRVVSNWEATNPCSAIAPPCGSPQEGQVERYPIRGLLTGTTYYWRVLGKTFAQLSKASEIRSFTTSGTSTGGSGTPTRPFTGTPIALPGTIQAEAFDNHGTQAAYSDTTSGNSGGVYRSTDVDLEATSEGGYHLMKTRAGEWLIYTVNVASTGTYRLEVRLASVGTGARFRVEVDGVNRTGSVAVPDTGGWQSWGTVTVTGIPLSAGTRSIKLVMESNGTSGGNANFNWLRIAP